MGLSAPKKRAKLSHDPNNTAWARNTESFGHKILSSQGWAPGQTLGAEGAAHATHYTAASNSHIRVLLKDDQLGLGASRGANNADTFGLSLFSGILGRLNGKSEVQLEKEQATQRDVELALYQSRKGGFVNFVSAGFLVGDRIDKAELMSKERLDRAKKEGDVETTNRDETADKKEQLVKAQGTKRKRTVPVQAETDAVSSSDSHDERDVTSSHDSSDSEHEDAANIKRAKKNNKESKHKASSTGTDQDDERAVKKVSKAERRADKDQRRAEKDKRRAEKEERRRAKDAKRADKEERRRKKDAKRAAKSSASTSADSRSGTSTPQAVPFIGRHAVRQRYIAAKGRAHLDPQALKEIFMVKAA